MVIERREKAEGRGAKSTAEFEKKGERPVELISHGARRDGATPGGRSDDRFSNRTEEVAATLGRIPGGLFVVTWIDPMTGCDRGMLASWVMQAGFEPPSISLSVAPSRPLAAVIEAGSPFVVNLLAESQRNLVGRFGRPAVDGVHDPFDGIAVDRSPCGAAILVPGSGWLECVGASVASAGDHRVVVATVQAAGGGLDSPQTAAGAPIVHLRKNGLRY